jgi:GTPase
MKTIRFVDVAIMHALAGDGGDGCCSFRREKYVPKGGPDGGDGGRGGHVILKVAPDLSSLLPLFYQPHQRAGRGVHGKGKKLNGKVGRDCIVAVPRGTVVRDPESGSALADLVEPGQTFLAARGGQGGLGNCHWTTSTHQAPLEHTAGEPGEKKTLTLELKTVADVGLVGFPNAGKSSLLACISEARPKVAAYPFTTLHPSLGTLMGDDCSRITVADIPGLIDGAHRGVGLGHAFLRHIERAPVLVVVLDMAGVDGRKPEEDYSRILEELRLHKPELPERVGLIVANKMDRPEAAEQLQTFVRATERQPLTISAQNGEGVPALKAALFALCRKTESLTAEA